MPDTRALLSFSAAVRELFQSFPASVLRIGRRKINAIIQMLAGFIPAVLSFFSQNCLIDTPVILRSVVLQAIGHLFGMARHPVIAIMERVNETAACTSFGELTTVTVHRFSCVLTSGQVFHYRHNGTRHEQIVGTPWDLGKCWGASNKAEGNSATTYLLTTWE
ncbi:hypothetical protein B0H11DRAFT_2266596 [Mycena galericulata]|nr:hypothetical protein B0H11DRAFT_2266596 [Mycena galericulata]